MNNTITLFDIIIIILYGIGMLAIGFYYSRKNKSSDDYMLGGRGMKSWKVGISLFATLFSAITYIGLPGEMIKYGPMIFLMLTAIPFIYLTVAYLFIPFIMKLKVSSAYELLELKLGLKNRILGSSIFLITRFMWMALMIYLMADIIIIPIFGWTEQTALLVSIGMGIITIIYASLGGLRGVVITDVIQSFILFAGAIIAIIVIIINLGSVTDIVPTEWPENWAGWVFYDTNTRVSLVTAFFANYTWFVFTAGSDQMSIQRCLATRDVKEARRMYLISLVVDSIVILLLAILGFALFAYVNKNPDFLVAGKSIMESADSIFPRFIALGLPTGLSGLVIAGLLAATMSSLSAGINSSSLSIVNDFILRLGNKKISEEKKIKISIYISFLIGALIVMLSLFMGNIKGNIFEITFKTVNLFVATLFIPFFMAMFVPFAKPNATFIGTILSGVSAILIGFSQELFEIKISFLWIMPVSFIVGVFTSIILSLLSNEKSNEIDIM